jgi:hypothetical protein
MKHRGRIRLANKFLTVALTLAITAFSSSAFAQQQEQGQEQGRGVDAVEIWKMIIRDSIASYPHSCPCPYSLNRAGRWCGNRSVYSRVGSLKCYPTDIPEAEVTRYRERMQ